MNKFIIHTNPKQSTESYIEACQIANANYDKTDEHVAVEDINANIISYPSEH